jgi:hypothetical protein
VELLSNKEIEIPIYTYTDYKADSKAFESDLKNGKGIDINRFKRLMIRDVLNSGILETKSPKIGGRSLTRIREILDNPSANWKEIIKISNSLMRISPHYYRINNTLSNMMLFNFGVDLAVSNNSFKADTIKAKYGKIIMQLEKMNLKHEFKKIAKFLPYQDVYCGLVAENNNTFFVQRVKFNHWKLHKIEDGLYSFIINLQAISPKEINAYPDYVRKEWNEYHKAMENKQNYSSWYEPDYDKQICVKLNHDISYPYPWLIGLLQDILDLDTYKKLKLQSARTDNYKAILIKVPIDSSAVDKPLLTLETLAAFAEINKSSMSDDIGMIHTLGSDGEAISFQNNNNTRNNVSDAIDEIHNASGETKELFNGSSSGTAVTMSIENLSGFAYDLYRQYERWVNRYIKNYNTQSYMFRFYLLDMTIFNKKEISNKYKDACTLGATVIDKWMASMDMTPATIMGSFALHKTIYDFSNNFTPLSSSYNSSANNVGRPTNESKGELLDESGEITADADSNIDR